MALIQCPECRNDVSDKAETCPRCGYPIRKKREKNACVRARRAFATVDLLFGTILFLVYYNVEIETKSNLSMAAWFLL